MSTKSRLMEILKDNTDCFISGQELAGMIGVSRNSIWKAVNSLEKDGFNIKALPSTGYKLISNHDALSKDLIREQLDYDFDIHILDEVGSTNDYAKTIKTHEVSPSSENADASVSRPVYGNAAAAVGRPVLVIADEQTGGRGRMGRSFYSPAGAGLYMSISFRPDFSIDRAMLVTSMAALACCHAIDKVTGLNPKIKWVNDIFINEKKVGGILTEASTSLENGSIDRLTVGIGINCYECKMPPELRDIAGRLADPPKAFSRNELAAVIVNCFVNIIRTYTDRQIIVECKSRSNLLGESILVFNPAIAREMGRPESKLNEGIKARAIDIDDNGGLVVEFLEGRYSHLMKTLTSGEVTIRKI